MKIVKRILIVIFGFIGFVIVSVVAATYFFTSQPAKFVNKDIVFENKLAVPKLLTPQEIDGEKVFDLMIQKGETEIFKGKKTETWGYNGSILGPTLRIRAGDVVRMQVKNNLQETTTIHWHGMVLPANMDGGPHQAIEPEHTWEPSWIMTNEAATLWYHPHTMEKTAKQVYNGLAGLILIDDNNSDSLAVPKQYGFDDIPLVVQDRKFDADGQLVYDHKHGGVRDEITTGMLGNMILVNGTYAPYLEVPTKLIRIRLLNGSNARRYNFGFSDNRTFYQIASDGGLLPKPVKKDRIQLSPGERAEILVDASGDTKRFRLLSYPVLGDPNKVRGFVLGLFAGATDEYQQFNIVELRPKKGVFAKEEIPQTLNTITYFDEKKAVKTREIKLDTVAINGKKMDVTRVDEIVHSGDIEIWHIRNQSPIFHPIHIHGVQFQVLSRNGQNPSAEESGWKDTITVLPEEDVKVIMKFVDYSDPTVSYMFHCHILEHEDMGMMGQFVVVAKDTKKEDIKIQNNYKAEEHQIH